MQKEYIPPHHELPAKTTYSLYEMLASRSCYGQPKIKKIHTSRQKQVNDDRHIFLLAGTRYDP